MTTKLNVGQDFKLPLDVITMATAILGLRGSGKTNTAGVWTEELLKVGQQVIVIDPQNVWWGLKSSADGKQAGFPIVIFGGDHADVPITGTEGKQLADFVVENQVPCIFSLRHLSLNAQRKFVTALTEQIFYRKGEAKYQTPALVIIDEAHKFVPQKVQGDDMAMLVHRIQMLVTEGRASGIGVTLIDQRAATVNKDVLTQIELMVVHRTVGPQDKKALDEWIRDNAEEGQAQVFKESLAKLGTGEAWFWSVGWLDIFKKVQVRMRETFDSSRTPRPGEKRITPKNLAEVDLEKLKTELSETIEKAKADDPKELKKQIAELRRQVLQKPIAQLETKIETRTIEVFPKALGAKLGARIGTIGNAVTAIEKSCQDVRNLIDEALTMIIEAAKSEPKAMAAVANVSRPQTPSLPKPAPIIHKNITKSITAEIGDLKLNKKQQEILDAISWWESIGIREPTGIQVGAVALVDPTGGHFSNLVSPLSSNGLIERANGKLALTDAGRSIANVPETASTLNGYHDVLRNRVRKMKAAGGRTIDILDTIIAAGGNPITSEEIGQVVGIDHTGGHFSNTIGPLSTAGLISRANGVVTPTNVLFPEGLS